MGDFNQAKYIQEYQKEKYDRCIFNIPKGQREVLLAHLKSKGFKSLNQYINELIRRDMEGDGGSISAKNIVSQTGDNNTININ